MSSRANARYKSLLQLGASQRARRDAEKALIEGIHLCAAYLEKQEMPYQAVASQSFLTHGEARDLFFVVPEARRLVLEDALFAHLSELESGAGIAYVIDIARAHIDAIPAGVSLLLDRIQDPGNVGSIFRTAAAAGIRHIFCSIGTAAAWSPKTLRGAMGAHFHLQIVEECDLATLIETSAVPLFATSARASRSLFATELPVDMAWLFGNEGQGADVTLIEHATTIGIPQPGGMESLNVAAAAAICLFEQVRRRGVFPPR